MSLAQMRHRLAFLNAPRLEAITGSVAAAIDHALAPILGNGLVPRGTLNAAAFTLLYAAMRHRSWLSCPLLTPILIDHLATHFGFPEELAAACVRSAIGAAKQNLNPPQRSDRDFLKYICVATALSQNELELETDLGIGRNLLGRIKEALGLISEQSEVVRYLAELDHEIADAVSSLASELTTSPWALQRARLSYLLLDAAGPWEQIIKEHGSDWIFDLLVRFVEKQTMSLREISAAVSELVPAACETSEPIGPEAICQLLTERGLIAADGPKKWRNLPLASQITAEAVANGMPSAILNRQGQLSRYDSDLQVALVSSAHLKAEDLLTLVREEPALSPGALRAALRRISRDIGQAEANQLLRVLAARELPTFALAVIREMMLDLPSSHGQESYTMANSGYENRTQQLDH
ncbi:MAG: hypothetical protein FJ146_05655 [Deltaproteobacteria bacterium]|nr:hypothetical protein [Deltaproteobacteria bacterium]